MTTIIETERLISRTWRKDDADPYFQINQDPKVIEFLRGPLTMEQVNDFIHAVNNHGDKHGYTLWAVCLKATEELIGFIGLNYSVRAGIGCGAIHRAVRVYCDSTIPQCTGFILQIQINLDHHY